MAKNFKHQHKQSPKPQSASGYWLYGMHPVTLALQNPERKIHRLLCAEPDALPRDVQNLIQDKKIRIESADRKMLDNIVGAGAVHQGIAASVDPLPDVEIEDILHQAKSLDRCHVLILDQVTDPHNIGAIMRSAAAFGSLGVIVQDKNSPAVTAVLAKSASGAVDLVPLVRVTNIVRAMEQLKEANFWCLGLDANGGKTLAECDLKSGKVALILGAEGDGMRHLVADSCDMLVKLPIVNAIGSLNVSNAAAIALYELIRDRNGS